MVFDYHRGVGLRYHLRGRSLEDICRLSRPQFAARSRLTPNRHFTKKIKGLGGAPARGLGEFARDVTQMLHGGSARLGLYLGS